MDVKLTEELLMARPSLLDHYRSKASEAQETYDKWYSLTPEEQRAWAQRFKDETIASLRKGQEDRAKLWHRYQRMKQQVQSWKPPTSEHNRLKEFMLTQIGESVKYMDPNEPDNYFESTIKKFEKSTLDDLVMEHTMTLIRDVSFYLTEVSKYEQYEKDGKKWITELLNSVPLPT
jgi:hypothetical protein